MTTAERIKQARLKAGLSKKELSEKYRIPLRSIQQWEEGSRKPPEYVIDLLVRCLELDFNHEPAEQEQDLSAPKQLIFTDHIGKPLKEPFLSAVKQAYDDRKVQFIPATDDEGNQIENPRKGKLYMVLAPEEYGLDMGFEFRIKEV
ncbi:helix-turn-helix domain-containing protein [Gudongella oleilytica]|uniref:helix-turn-helix domain-containing protein n=1 Tax=Gudongella oleilytica TaxID=1582259 RepID=UPI000FF8950F|nr:helix-turn-helix transcriptional regulator [Gudongella oleilytica]